MTSHGAVTSPSSLQLAGLFPFALLVHGAFLTSAFHSALRGLRCSGRNGAVSRDRLAVGWGSILRHHVSICCSVCLAGLLCLPEDH